MIQMSDGDLFASGSAVVVIPVNTRGILGKGVAKDFAEKYPERCDLYRKACNTGVLLPGGVFVDDSASPIFVFAATKDAWWKPSKISWIASICSLLPRLAAAHGWKSVAVPALGAGLGGLPWDAVEAEIQRFMSHPSTVFIVFRPKGLDKPHAIW